MKLIIKILLLISYSSLFCKAENIWIPHQTSPSFHYRDVHFVNRDLGWIVGENGLILNTINGGEVWNFQDSKTLRSILSVHFVNKDLGFACGTGGIVYKTTNGGNQWNHIEVAPPDTTFWSIFFIDQDNGWTVGHNGSIFKTTNQGKNWYRQKSQTENILWSVFFIDDTTGWIVGDYSVILKTTDGGKNWIDQSCDKTDGLKDIFFINPDTGWIVGGWNGGMVLNTKDGGNAWNLSNTYDITDLKSIWFIDSMQGWAVGEQGQIIFTSDRGKNWNIQRGSPLDPKLRSICFVENQFGWIVGEEGIILSTDLKTHVEGIIENKNEKICKITDNKSILKQNNPNPFNESTQISFELFEFCYIILNVYDILGNKVAQLVNQNMNPGYYVVTWNPKNIASGIYFYQIRTNQSTQIKKIIYQK